MPVDSRHSSFDGREVDDWLRDVGEIDWDGDGRATSRRPERVGESTKRPRSAPPGAGGLESAEPRRHAAEHPHEGTIRRRRAIGLLVLLVILGGLIWVAVAAFGGGSGESTAETLQTTTARQPSTSTATTPATTTPTTTTPATTTPAATTPPLTVDLPAGEKLRRDSSGDVVKQLQEGLTALGLEPGPADGDFGPVTEAAVVEFQQSKGLATDGVVGVNTARELNAALAELPAADSTG
jgi:hypothetical protein